MFWLVLVLLTYCLIGALLVVRQMRGFRVEASLGEWIMMIALWPYFLRFFAHLAMLQSMVRELEHLEFGEDP